MLISQQPLRVQLGEAEVLHSTLAKPIFPGSPRQTIISGKGARASSVLRHFLMIFAGLPAGNN
jgi:hypothetical protein